MIEKQKLGCRGLALVLIVCLLSGRPSPAQPRFQVELTTEAVSRAIDRAILKLKQAQRDDGTWPDQANYHGGLTPLCTLALLHAGCSIDEPEISKAIAHLKHFEPDNTYSLALQTMVFCRIDPAEYRPLIARNVLALTERQITDGKESGMWARPNSESGDHTDNSMTHFAMLGLYEAEKCGVEVGADVWKRSLEYWERSQNPDGSWGWGPEYPGSGSMTCAGMAAIMIASGQIGDADAKIVNGQVECCGEQTDRRTLARALSWFERNYLISRNPGWEFWHSYYLYSLERAGRLTARRFFGKHDWYREGAAMLLKTQKRDGGWPPDQDWEYISDDVVSTSFSLMFLAKARRPIVVAQLQHLPQNDWNHHRGALFNLVGHVENLWHTELTHQTIDIASATVEDLLESPVLYLHGNQAPEFTADEISRLRQYVERGGFIFAEKACSDDFDVGFRRLMRQMFPEEDSALLPLRPDHVVWFTDRPIKPRSDDELWGIEFGCRTSVIYSTTNLSCHWELARPGREQSLPKELWPGIDRSRALGANILAYATNRKVKYRSPAIELPPTEVEAAVRGNLRIARVQHLGGCDAAPRAINQLLRLATDDYGLPPVQNPPSIRLTDPQLFQHSILIFSGRSDFRLTEAERRQLKLYLERGGKIIADAVASSPEFGRAFRREIQLMFPDLKLARVPTSDALYSDHLGGTDIKQVRLRKTERSADGGGLMSTYQDGTPILEGLKIGENYAILFSPLDLSCTLDSPGLLSFEGYEPSDAARIGINLLFYFIQN